MSGPSFRKLCPTCQREMAVNKNGIIHAHRCEAASSPEEASVRSTQWKQGYSTGYKACLRAHGLDQR